MKVLMKIAGFFWNNPWACLALIGAVGYGVLKWQGYRIEGLKLEKIQLEQTLKVERKHNTKIVKAFEDKGASDHDREEFVRNATAEAAGKRSGLPPAPVLADTYKRLYDRASGKAADTR